MEKFNKLQFTKPHFGPEDPDPSSAEKIKLEKNKLLPNSYNLKLRIMS